MIKSDQQKYPRGILASENVPDLIRNDSKAAG
jgi:hypothetical protein